jgi:hypothetical protein
MNKISQDEMRNAYRTLSENHSSWKTKHIWENNFKMDHKEIEYGVDLIPVAHDRDQKRAAVKSEINRRVR